MKLLAMDGNSIINRAFFGVRPLTTKDGQHTNAIFGFMTMMQKMLDDVQPDAVAIAFDLKAPTFRHKAYDGYKAKRKGMPEELFSQMQPLKDLLTALGYKLVTCEGWEADDILGTLSEACRRSGDTCVIATGDRDSFQLINESVQVRMLSTKAGRPEATLFDVDAIKAQYGVAPKQLIDIKAIQGDTSDNIPGVPGIGEKGAGDLISRFGSLDGVYENINDASIKEGMRKKLNDGKESAYMSRMLGTIVLDAPIDTDISSYIPKEADSAAVRAMLIKLEMFKLLEKLGVSDKKSAKEAEKEFNEKKNEPARVLYDPEDWLDTIGTDLYFVYNEKDGELDSAAFMNGNDIIVLTAPSLGSFIINVLTNDAINKHTYDIKTLYKLVPETVNCVFDAMLAAYLLDPSSKGYELDKLLALYVSEIPPEAEKENILPACAERIAPLCRSLESKIAANGQEKLLREIEMPLSRVLADMETVGFMVDSEGIAAFGNVLSERISELEKEIYESVGYEFNLNSPKQLGEALFVKLMLPGGKKTKTGWSTNAEVLDGLRGAHPAVDGILEYRMLQKLNSTYCVGMLKTIAADGRIHSTFNQTETRTGRISSTEPNLQNIPVRTELGSRLRQYFVPREGCVLVDCDYSQIELRVLAHCANDERMINGFATGEDIHRITASQVFGVPLEEVTPKMRSNAKAVNFGIVYGIGAYSLAKDICVSNAEASAYIKGYLNTYSGVDQYMKDLITSAKEKGYAETLYGRRRYLPELGVSNHATRAFGERVARNMPIQGTAADIIKIAMVRVYERLKKEGMKTRLILQVHDELILEAPENEAEKALSLLQEEMENAAKLSVHLAADGTIGKNWLEAKG